MIGTGPDTIDRITAELDRKFKGAASPKVLPSKSDIRPGDYVAYSYLFKNLAFETPFSKAPHGMSFGHTGGRAILYGAFGLFDNTSDWSKAASQVTVWHYGAADDFVIELRTKEAGDRLIVARLKPGATLKETADAALASTRAEKTAPGIRKGESVMIPVLNFDITRSYDEVCGIPATSPSALVGFAISSAVQNIRVRLDEKGAVLKSDAAITVRGAAHKEPEARRFVCDGPFLVLMQRQGADTPYFAAWIDNPELLVPQK
jgi:hypothetical protein